MAAVCVCVHRHMHLCLYFAANMDLDGWKYKGMGGFQSLLVEYLWRNTLYKLLKKAKWHWSEECSKVIESAKKELKDC